MSRSTPRATTHDFILFQGRRIHDTEFLQSSPSELSNPTQHGAHLMRSYLETLWAKHFECKGFAQAVFGICPLPCYFFEPSGTRKLPSYRKGGHYRIDFVLVHDAVTVLVGDDTRSRAVKWNWVSIKAERNDEDLRYLKELVILDSRHQTAFQCIGDPSERHIIKITYDAATRSCREVGV